MNVVKQIASILCAGKFCLTLDVRSSKFGRIFHRKKNTNDLQTKLYCAIYTITVNEQTTVIWTCTSQMRRASQIGEPDEDDKKESQMTGGYTYLPKS